MYSRSNALLIPALIPMLLFATSADAQSYRCPDGSMSRPATQDEANADGGTAIIAGITQYCESASGGITAEVGRAKQYLKSLPKQFAGSSSYDCKTYEDKNIDKLNGQFAVCMERFLRAYTGAGNRVTITSAYRSPEEQTCVCKGETGLCGRSLQLDANGRPIGGIGVGHQYGTAMDIRAGGGSNPEYQRMHEFAKRFGVHFRLGMADRPHVEPATRECGLGSSTTPPGYSGPATPTSGLANQLRNALGMPQQPMPMMQQPIAQQPLQQQQSPLSAFNQAPQPTLQPISGSIGIPSSPTPTKSVADQLRDIVNGTTTVTYSTTTSATTAPIVINSDSAGTIVSVSYSSSSQQYGSGSLQPVGQYTFSSNDVGLQQPVGTPAVTARLIQLYTALRDTLLRILDIVRPFGGTRDPSLYVN